jgi:FtsP/CotA-like multicopper oxidase with cupredoxin domain
MADWSRRRMLKTGVLATAATMLGWRLARADATFPSPPLLEVDRSQRGLAVADFAASRARALVAGRTAWILGYGGSYPGPTVRITEGETVRLTFRNDLDQVTNLHFHGLHISPSVDNPLLELAPGESHLYEFTVPLNSAGTYWYHPHVHGRVAEQLFAGLAGAIIVDPRDPQPDLSLAQDHLIVLKDVTLNGDEIAAHTPMDWRRGKIGDYSLVNGAVNPTLTATSGLLRLRFLNASNARYYRLRMDGHVLNLIATDGGMIEKPLELSELHLAPGVRAEVLVQLDRSGTFRVWDSASAGTSRHGTIGMGRGGMSGGSRGMSSPRRPQFRPFPWVGRAHPLMTIVVPSTPSAVPLPARLSYLDRLDPSIAQDSPSFVLSDGTMMGSAFLINGRSFDPNREDTVARVGSVAVWQVRNQGMMEHPFHLHTYPFQVIERDGVPEALLAWRDVVNVSPGETVRFVVRYSDLTGRTVYHCHIPEHEDQGMMGILDVS